MTSQDAKTDYSAYLIPYQGAHGSDFAKGLLCGQLSSSLFSAYSQLSPMYSGFVISHLQYGDIRHKRAI
jgi:hypothetical protein